MEAVKSLAFRVRYKAWRSRKDSSLHHLCAKAAKAFEPLSAKIRSGVLDELKEGEVGSLSFLHMLRSVRGTLYQFAALRRSCLVTEALAPSRPGIQDACS